MLLITSSASTARHLDDTHVALDQTNASSDIQAERQNPEGTTVKDDLQMYQISLEGVTNVPSLTKDVPRFSPVHPISTVCLNGFEGITWTQGKTAQLLPSVLDEALRCSHLSYSMSSHLDSSPESSENGTDAPLTPKERQQILRGVQNIAVKAARRRSKVLEIDALRLPPPPSPLDPKKHKTNLSLSEAPLKAPGLQRGRQPSPELRHATSDDNLSSSTGDGPGTHGTWTRPRNRQGVKNPGQREQDYEGRRRKRRSRSFETKTSTQRFRPLDSTSDPHLHINGQPQAPLLRPQHRTQAQLSKARTTHNIQQTGSTGDVLSSNLPSHLIKRGPQTRQLQPLLYVTTTGTGAQRTRKH
ncbi:hypothetical protein DNTS_007640 [Danionella cerebrum]|uniref:Uncharacterized protein n=1 Tax=Danionella cerebrum TaxID=2873325 RepID=A0A553PZA8_9TELE|nr:hypothetical protein DNTS_007640 [Danionella translucida]